MKRRQESKGHLQTIKHKGNDKVRTLKESEQVMGTHTLLSIKGRTSQAEKASEQGALTCCQAQRKGQVRTWKEGKCTRCTHFLLSTEEQQHWQVRTGQECKQAMGTHSLLNAEEVTG